MTDADADAAVRAAADAFSEWSLTAPATRRELLEKAAHALEARGEETARMIAEETCGTFGWGMFNVSLAAAILRSAGALAEEVPVYAATQKLADVHETSRVLGCTGNGSPGTTAQVPLEYR